MATAEQIKALIKSHLGEDDDRFLVVAMQVAAPRPATDTGEWRTIFAHWWTTRKGTADAPPLPFHLRGHAET